MNTNPRFLFILLFVFLINSVNSYSTIKGVVVDSLTLAPLTLANVYFADGETSRFVKGSVTNSLGEFEMDNLSVGKYNLFCSFVGYNTKVIPIEVDNNNELSLGLILLSPKAYQLSNIEILYEPLYSKEEENLTINVEMMGNIEEMSAADVLETVSGVYFDFDGELQYGGYHNFTQLIEGRSMDSKFVTLLQSGSYQYYMLKQIPARNIKKIELFPEPRGRYGFFSPIINIIPKGNLRNYTELAAGIGFKNKYEVTAAFSNNFNNWGIRPELAHQHNTLYKDETERYTFDEQFGKSYVQKMSTEHEKNISGFNLSSYFGLKESRPLKMEIGATRCSSKDAITRHLAYCCNKESRFLDNRSFSPEECFFSLNYRHDFHVGINQDLFLLTNLKFQRSKNLGEENQFDVLRDEQSSRFRSSQKNKDSNFLLNVYYTNRKQKLKYSIKGNYQMVFQRSNSDRHFFENDFWVVLPSYLHDFSYRRIDYDLSADIRYGTDKKENRRLHHSLLASVTKRFSFEDRNNRFSKKKFGDKQHFTNWNLRYSNSFAIHGACDFNYYGNNMYPSADQVVSSPEYIDRNNVRVGNPMLKPEQTHTLSVRLGWNPPGMTYLISSKKAPPVVGLSLSAIYVNTVDKIVPVYQINDDILLHTFTNSGNYNNATVKALCQWKPIPLMQMQLGGSYSCDRYIDGKINSFYDNWNASSSIKISIAKNYELVCKYSYQSKARGFRVINHSYHDANIFITGLFFNASTFITLEASRILGVLGRRITVIDTGMGNNRKTYIESPVIMFKINYKLFRYYK